MPTPTPSQFSTNLVGISMRHNKAIGDLDVALDVGAQQGAHDPGHLLIPALVVVDHREQDGRVDLHIDWN